MVIISVLLGVLEWLSVKYQFTEACRICVSLLIRKDINIFLVKWYFIRIVFANMFFPTSRFWDVKRWLMILAFKKTNIVPIIYYISPFSFCLLLYILLLEGIFSKKINWWKINDENTFLFIVIIFSGAKTHLCFYIFFGGKLAAICLYWLLLTGINRYSPLFAAIYSYAPLFAAIRRCRG